MSNQAGRVERVFKTAWFSKAAKKSYITDAELCTAIQQVILGQADDLGGGVYKKRLSKNQYRSIIVAKGGRYWVYAYLFAKQDQANIKDSQLSYLREYATLFAKKSELDIEKELLLKDLMEICHDQEAKI